MFQRNLSGFHAPLCLVTQVESLARQVCPYSYSFCANVKSSETVFPPPQTKGLALESSGKFFTVLGWGFCRAGSSPLLLPQLYPMLSYCLMESMVGLGGAHRHVVFTQHHFSKTSLTSCSGQLPLCTPIPYPTKEATSHRGTWSTVGDLANLERLGHTEGLSPQSLHTAASTRRALGSPQWESRPWLLVPGGHSGGRQTDKVTDGQLQFGGHLQPQKPLCWLSAASGVSASLMQSLIPYSLQSCGSESRLPSEERALRELSGNGCLLAAFAPVLSHPVEEEHAPLDIIVVQAVGDGHGRLAQLVLLTDGGAIPEQYHDAAHPTHGRGHMQGRPTQGRLAQTVGACGSRNLCELKCVVCTPAPPLPSCSQVLPQALCKSCCF